MLNGQKLQGPPTAAEVNTILKKMDIEEKYAWAFVTVSFLIFCTRYKLDLLDYGFVVKPHFPSEVVIVLPMLENSTFTTAVQINHR